MNTPFLQQVVNHYLGVQDLEDYCFVFPNRRSGQFFTHYLQQSLVAAERAAHGRPMPHLLPRVTSINELVGELTGTVAATDVEMTFALYDAYCQVMGDKAQIFDKFIYWAQLIISDFNDIDRSLADAREIYQNLDELHSLSSNYLSPEVQEQVKRIFGENLFTAFFDTSADADLWQRRGTTTATSSGDDRVRREFMSLWNALGSIYHRYHEALSARDVLSPGRQLRKAAEGPLEHLRYDRLVFVGFGVLSAAEFKLLDRFKQDKKADFWWDNAGLRSLLDKAPHDPGSLLIDGYCKHFGARDLEPVSTPEQDIRVVAVSSMVGQAKQAFNEVSAMTAAAGIETAIVLPDEGLLVPLLHSVHGVDNLNVTLGYPLRSSGIVSLMHIVSKMHHQASKERGRWTYYREDVNDLLSHPLIKTYFTGEVLELTAELSKTNRFRIPASEFEALSFGMLFVPAIDSETDGETHSQQVGYIDNLLSFSNLLMGKMRETSDADTQDDDNGDVELPLQQAFLMMYIDVLNQLKQALAECRQTLLSSTVFYLIDRLTSAAIVPFTGQPLKGLQIMGLLETRSLDFENLVILSMNERVFPRRRSISSFIPNYIRRAHGMSTIEQQEAIVAFNFYRLLNRARHVTLIYDSSDSDASPSEPSRYISQLEMIFGYHLKHIEMTPDVLTSSPIEIKVPHDKCPDLRERYTLNPAEGHGKCLSASAINKYIDCPLMFYLHYVQGLNNDNEVSDFMDPSTFGTIVHDTLSDCYYSEPVPDGGRLIDSAHIESFKRNRLSKAVVRNIKKTYLHVPEDKLDDDREPLKGEAFMLVDTIESYVKFVLDYDLNLIKDKGPFTILECEKTHVVHAMPLGGTAFNFTYKPDRVDRLADGTVRIVDYKTGSEETLFSSLDNLYPQRNKKRCSGILQLMLYCYAYLRENPEVDKVMPFIYRLGLMKESGVRYKPPKSDVKQYEFSMEDQLAQDFINRMAATVEAIYLDDFGQAEPDSKCCNYCRFIDFCRRSPQKFN